MRAYATVYNVGDMLEGFTTVKRLATSPQHVVPGHDPLVLQRYPSQNRSWKASPCVWMSSLKNSSHIAIRGTRLLRFARNDGPFQDVIARSAATKQSRAN